MFEDVKEWTVNPCLQCSGGTRCAYYYNDYGEYVVMFADNPKQVWRGTQKEFNNRFVISPPLEMEALRQKIKNMLPFDKWRRQINREMGK